MFLVPEGASPAEAIAILGAYAALVAAAGVVVTKFWTGLSEAIVVLKGIRNDQAAGDVVKARIGQESLRAQPGANPITADDLVRATDKGPVRDAAVGILEKAAVPATPPPPALSEEDRELLVEAIVARLLPPKPVEIA